MTTIRIGTDLVQVEQVHAAIETFGDTYLRRVYSAREIAHCRDLDDQPVAERLAARFAAKEAVIKVLRPTAGVALTDIEVVVGRDGAPTIELTGSAADAATGFSLEHSSLSLTHDGPLAAAVLVALGPDPIPRSTPSAPPAPVHQENAMTVNVATIRNVLAAHGRLSTDIAKIGDDDSLYGAGLTSHATVSVMLALEDEFDIEFPETLLRRSTFESIDSLDAAVGQVLEATG